MPLLEDVFGINTSTVLSYVERPQVDERFTDALKRHHHLVIYGSSKQGKTALRQKHLNDDECVVVRCGPKTTPEGIYQSILRNAGIRIETKEIQTRGESESVKFAFKAMIPWTLEAEAGQSSSSSITSEFVGHDLSDAQSITEILDQANYSKYVVLENFHYLSIEVQKQLSFDLKTFHEVGIRFIILGIWQEADSILLHNGDLTERIVEVPVEPWEAGDFEQVIEKGSDFLNISFPTSSRNKFIENAYGNVGMLQEFLKEFCKVNGTLETESERKALSNGANVDETFERKLVSQRRKLVKALEGIAGKSRTDGDAPLILPYYLVQVVLSASLPELQAGIRRSDLLEKIRAIHHREEKETIRIFNIAHLLKRLPFHQADMKPPLLYFDENQQRLKIVDTSQFFSLSRLDREELKDEILNPLESYE